MMQNWEVTLTPEEIEDLALKIVAAEDAGKTIESIGRELLGHLGPGDFDAVIERSIEVSTLDFQNESFFRQNVIRLARASGCPAGVNPIGWLMERGLIVEDESGDWRMRVVGPA